MWAQLAHKLAAPLMRRGLATAPAVWGKLPDHGDFVHHRASLPERQAWHAWVQAWWPHGLPARTRRKPASAQPGWMHLTPQRDTQAHRRLPVAFVLPPGAMPFAPRHCVQGVMLDSQDKVGRCCPLVIYQQVSPTWVQRSWSEGSAMGGQDQLYWWARMALRVVNADMPWATWRDLLDPVWAAHAPGVSQLLGAPPGRATASHMEQLVGPVDDSDPAASFFGVSQLPWADWPQRILRSKAPASAFWTQDVHGRYVHASHSLLDLWSRQP